jgi:hypothetical protein
LIDHPSNGNGNGNGNGRLAIGELSAFSCLA